MSAIPKRRREIYPRKRPAFEETPKVGDGRQRAPTRREWKPRLRVPLDRLERPFSIAAIVVSLIAWSVVANGTLLAKIQARDSRAAVQRLRSDISQTNSEIEDAKASLEAANAPEGAGTLPIDPASVVRLTLPPAL